jgi:hypothetical protein
VAFGHRLTKFPVVNITASIKAPYPSQIDCLIELRERSSTPPIARLRLEPSISATSHGNSLHQAHYSSRSPSSKEPWRKAFEISAQIQTYTSTLIIVPRGAVESTESTPLDRLERSVIPLSLKMDSSPDRDNSSRTGRGRRGGFGQC